MSPSSGELIVSCIPESHLHRVTYIRCCIDAINSPDDGHSCLKHAENRNKHIGKELCVKLVIYKYYKRDARSTKHKVLQCNTRDNKMKVGKKDRSKHKS